MASLALSHARPTTPPNATLVGVLLLLALVLPNPAGYVGGGGDDWYYVEAARCVAASGWCEPQTHWATRWPLVAPMAGAFALLGDGWWQGALVPLAYTLIATVLFINLLEVAWGRAVALVGGIAFVATASFAKGLLQPNVETVELAWLLGSAWCVQRALACADRWRWALAAGLCFGLAVEARMTSLAWLPILGVAVLMFTRLRPLAPVALIGAALPIMTHMAVNATLAGNALLAQRLSSAHTRIASSELAAEVDLTASPLFNPDFIGGWSPTMDIATHWSVQGIVNLLANPQMGPVLIAALVLLAVGRKTFSRRSVVPWLALAAAAYAVALIYALAIDPKARMFLPVAAIAAALVGKLGVDAWRRGARLLAGAIVAVLVIVGTVETAKRFDMGIAGPTADAWARERGDTIAVEDATRRFLAFAPDVQRLPVHPAGSRRHAMMLVAGTCRDAAQLFPPQDWTVMRSVDFGRPADPLKLCEYRAAPPHP